MFLSAKFYIVWTYYPIRRAILYKKDTHARNIVSRRLLKNLGFIRNSQTLFPIPNTFSKGIEECPLLRVLETEAHAQNLSASRPPS
jgi:hypothetical protein